MGEERPPSLDAAPGCAGKEAIVASAQAEDVAGEQLDVAHMPGDCPAHVPLLYVVAPAAASREGVCCASLALMQKQGIDGAQGDSNGRRRPFSCRQQAPGTWLTQAVRHEPATCLTAGQHSDGHIVALPPSWWPPRGATFRWRPGTQPDSPVPAWVAHLNSHFPLVASDLTQPVWLLSTTLAIISLSGAPRRAPTSRGCHRTPAAVYSTGSMGAAAAASEADDLVHTDYAHKLLLHRAAHASATAAQQSYKALTQGGVLLRLRQTT